MTEAPTLAPASTPSLMDHALRRLRASRTAMAGVVICVFLALVAIAGPWLAPADYKAQSDNPDDLRAAPSATAWFGRDELGRDQLSRVLWGARLTLGVGLATVLLGVALGTPLGLVSGYARGALDEAIMRGADILLAMPDYLLALAVMAVLGPSLGNAMLAVGIAFVPKFARVVRASALMESERDYVAAARALGAGHARILFVHVLPNCLAPLMVMATLSLGTAILYTSSLSFLGLGAQPPAPEWGAMLAEGREASLQAPHLMLFPGGAIALAVLGINLLGDGLRDALDVRL